MNIQQIVGTNILTIRKEKGLSQDDLAEKAGIDRTYVGPIEKGNQNITLQVTFQIAKALGVEVIDFFKLLGQKSDKSLTNAVEVVTNLIPQQKVRESDIETINRLLPAIREYQKL